MRVKPHLLAAQREHHHFLKDEKQRDCIGDLNFKSLSMMCACYCCCFVAFSFSSHQGPLPIAAKVADGDRDLENSRTLRRAPIRQELKAPFWKTYPDSRHPKGTRVCLFASSLSLFFLFFNGQLQWTVVCFTRRKYMTPFMFLFKGIGILRWHFW